jgi:hypothetical protein
MIAKLSKESFKENINEIRKGKDEFDNRYEEKHVGRIIERRYIGESIKGKNHIIETRQIGKAPDRIEVNVSETNKGYLVVINVLIGDKEKGGTWMVSKDFLKDGKEQEKFYRNLENYFKDVLVRAEIYPILMNVKDKIVEFEKKGEPYQIRTDLPKKIDPSEYVMIGDIYGEPIRKKWSEFEKEIYEHKGYEVIKREV